MSFPSTFVTRFFQLVNNRQFTEAQRQLQRLKEKIQRTEWNHGYYRALMGLYLAGKSNGNNYTFLSRLKTEDIEILERHRNDFLRHVHRRFHSDFDRGFFSAWSDYTRLLITIRKEQESTTDSPSQTSIIQYSESIKKAA